MTRYRCWFLAEKILDFPVTVLQHRPEHVKILVNHNTNGIIVVKQRMVTPFENYSIGILSSRTKQRRYNLPAILYIGGANRKIGCAHTLLADKIKMQETTDQHAQGMESLRIIDNLIGRVQKRLVTLNNELFDGKAIIYPVIKKQCPYKIANNAFTLYVQTTIEM
jgi:hypothetical protein